MMIKWILTLTASALILAGGVITAHSDQDHGTSVQQDRSGTMMMSQRDDDMMRPGRQRSERADEEDDDIEDDDMMRPGRQSSERDDRDDDDRWGMPGGFYGHGGPNWMRGGMMRSRMGDQHMMRMMMIMLDTDGDGALSLEEVQAVHARFFKAIDADSDGKVTLEEIQSFMSPARTRAPRQ